MPRWQAANGAVSSREGAWGFGLRVERAYCHRLDQLRADTLGGPSRITQAIRQLFCSLLFNSAVGCGSWLTLSSSFGVQRFLGRCDQPANLNPFVGQVGLHFVLNRKRMLRP